MKVRVAHASLQFADSPKQHAEDIAKIFNRARARRYAWITGTEAGDGSNNTAEKLVELGRAADYKMFVPSLEHGDMGNTDCWIAVRKDLISGEWETDYTEVIPSSDELYREAGSDAKLPRWGSKGIVDVGFDCDKLKGHVAIAALHYLTGAHHEGAGDHGVNRWDLNLKLDNALGRWMKREAEGKDLAFAAMDRNESDRAQRVNVPGGTTLADELKNWQNTGHGDIDWILSHNRDKRVTGANFRVLDDSEFKLNADHFFLEGTFDVAV